MGCAFSEASIRNLPGKELDAYVTREDKRLVKQSWKFFGNDLDGVGLEVFQRLFEMQEHLKKLFASMSSQKNGHHMFIDDDKLRSHGKIVMEALGSAVESLDDSVFLTNLLIAMGTKHSVYDVKTDMVVYFWPAIRDTMKDKLGDDFTPEVERAWSHVFEYIASKFQEGIRKGKKNGRNKAEKVTGI
ncbi:hypothetical protein FSP39_016261 [Pinctada imbricata]|uniref:Globin domain-containing protein n=1 Tax=Pinctada imbricata TaxID=66713 RepID=A0AA88XVX7_PINIB|nr:hypothetical protein FSP39_016261 [Pinctada imbricata]